MAVGDLGFIFVSNVVQHLCSWVVKFFSKVPVVLVDAHGSLVRERGGLGCRISLVVRLGCLEDVQSKQVAHGAGSLVLA
ncbi:hypothetical protein GOBAR_DD09311 [Gossypium barbadense]|nr:hypothetical protein GOBAR_DD09311 [Gossypium barbadense]